MLPGQSSSPQPTDITEALAAASRRNRCSIFSLASELEIWTRADLHAVSAVAFPGLQAGGYVIQWGWLGLLP